MKSRYFYIIYGILFLLYILNVFIEVAFIDFIISWSALLVLLLSWRFATNLFKLISILFSAAGVSMSLTAGVPLHHIPMQFINNFPMLLFLSMLPWMSSAFSIGEYDRSLRSMLTAKNNRLTDMYSKGMTTTYSLLLFINISAIYLMQQIFLEKLKDIDRSVRNDFIIKVTLRTFSLAAIWSPMEIIVGITVDATNVSFLSYLPWLLLISFSLAIFDVLFSKRTYAEIEMISKANVDYQKLTKAFIKLFFVLLTFFAIIISSNYLFELNFILTVSLVILPFTLVWSLFMRRFTSFLKFGWESWKSYNNGMQNFVVLFLSLALFSEGFNQSAIPGMMQQVLRQVSGYILLIFIFITVIYFIMGMIGVHPIATIAILIEVVQPLFSIINPMSIGIVLIVSALATSASAPYGINATLSAQMLKISPYYITKVNFPFSIAMSITGIIVAMLFI